MSEENTEAQTEETPQTVTEPEVKSEPPASKGKPEGWDRVEFNDEAIQKRFNRMYAQVKQGERLHQQLIEDNAKLVARLNALEARHTENDYKDGMKALVNAKKEAFARGDVDRVVEIDDKILELREAKTAQSTKKDEPEPKKAEDDLLTDDQKAKINEWTSEIDNEGNFVRPFAAPWHPRHDEFKDIVKDVLSKPECRDISVEEGFVLVDKALSEAGLLKKTKTEKRPIVLSSSNPVVPKGQKLPQLSPEQQRIARKMFPGDPKALETYAKALLEK